MIRDATPVDYPVIEALHRAGGLDYRLPPLDSPLLIVRKVVEGPEGVIGSCFLRLTSETFLLLDPALSPRRKFNAIQELQTQVVQSAWELGLEDMNARIPPEINQRFAKRLTKLGWEQGRSGWIAWSRMVNQCATP